jgi:hypothetical protein
MKTITLTINFKDTTYTKAVSVTRKENGDLYGKVGSAVFYWNKGLYSTPLLRLKDPNSINYKSMHKYTVIAKKFIDEYLFVTAGNTPVAFEESSKEVVPSIPDMKFDEVLPSTHTSGVPLWMKDDHKVWTKCIKKDGSSYMRRTRYKKESKEVVESYLPHCSSCPFRATCSKPCEDPSSSNRKESVNV